MLLAGEKVLVEPLAESLAERGKEFLPEKRPVVAKVGVRRILKNRR